MAGSGACSLVFPGAALIAALAAAPAADRPVERRFDFTYTAALHNIPEGTKKIAVWIPYPRSDAHQEITDVKVSCPYPARVTREPEYENSVLYVAVENPRESSFQVEISFDVRRKIGRASCRERVYVLV